MEQTTKKQNPYIIPGAIVIAGVIIAGAVFLAQKQPFFQFQAPEPYLSTEDESALEGINIDFEGWASMGNPDASVVIVEYSDFACFFCARFWQETLPLIKQDYIDTGKVRLVYKDFIVMGGDKAAEAAHCAKEQGAFWEYHDLLFSRYDQDAAQWSSSDAHRGYARQLGLDEDALVECFESRRYQGKAALSTQEAAQNGGQGTPYFIINNTPLFGAQPYSAFQKVIDSLLASQ